MTVTRIGELRASRRGAADRVAPAGRPDHAPLVGPAELTACLLPLIKGRPVEEEELPHHGPDQRNEDAENNSCERSYEKDGDLRGIVMHCPLLG